MRKALAEADCDDVPANGMYVIGGLAMDQGVRAQPPSHRQAPITYMPLAGRHRSPPRPAPCA